MDAPIYLEQPRPGHPSLWFAEPDVHHATNTLMEKTFQALVDHYHANPQRLERSLRMMRTKKIAAMTHARVLKDLADRGKGLLASELPPGAVQVPVKTRPR